MNSEQPESSFTNVSANPLKSFKESVNGDTIILRDKAKSNLPETELKKNEEQLKAAFKGFPIPSYIWQHTEEDFILIDHNDAADVFTNGSIKKLIGARFSKMYEKSPYQKDLEADLLKCFCEKTNVMRKMSYRFKSKDKLKELKIYHVFVPPDLIFVHIEDFTNNKISEDELKKLSSAVEQTADSVVITNKRGIIEYVNPAFVETTGFSREEALGKTPRILKSGKHDKVFYKKLWKTVLSGNSYQGTILNKKKNNELYWSQQTITPMINKNGQITNFVSVLRDITELKEKQEQQFRLKIASELQQRLYKTKISVPGFDIAGKTYSAVETCGDYFDFIQMKDGSIGIVIGDVCGHGIGAALIMVQTLASLRALAKFETDPGVILTYLNQALVDNLDDTHFVTLVLARLDPKQNLLEYASAGHIPAYLLRNSDENDEILESTGIPLGILKDYIYYTNKPIRLAKGNILALITDGVIEARLHDDTEFGFIRALDIIKSNRQDTSNQIVELIYQATRSFVKNRTQEDDITSIICKVSL